MASQKLTIKARRRMTSATILGDGTLVQWFEIVEEGTYNTLRTEIEVTQKYVQVIDWHHGDYPDWESRTKAQRKFYLCVSARYSEDDGFLPLLKGARVMVRFPHVSNGSQNTQAQGVRIGSVRVRNPKLGSVSFALVGGMSSSLEPALAQEDLPTFEEIVERGYYNGYMPVKVTRKDAPKQAPAAVAA